MALRLGNLLSALSRIGNINIRTCSINGMVTKDNRRRRYSTENESDLPYQEFNIQDTDDFDSRVISCELPTLVEFHASWCKPCQTLAPRLKEVLGARPGRLQLAKVDVDQHPELALKYEVSSIPKVIMIKDGKVAGEFIGLLDKDKIESFVDRLTL